jgi:hypothetical protein
MNIKQLNISPMKSSLVWSITPKLKNKRKTERVSFVITSENWKNLYEQKKTTKCTIEENK